MSRTPIPHAIDRKRRAFLRGGWRRPERLEPWRPPWARPDFEDVCTRCGACQAACPERILTVGEGGCPEVHAHLGSGTCTFCRACLEACPEPAFADPDQQVPWDRVAEIGDACLARQGVHCQTCGDVCDVDAIRFVLAIGRPPQAQLAADACTGCGACASACPANAITIVPGAAGFATAADQ